MRVIAPSPASKPIGFRLIGFRVGIDVQVASLSEFLHKSAIQSVLNP